jgi:hypothetical protein
MIYWPKKPTITIEDGDGHPRPPTRVRYALVAVYCVLGTLLMIYAAYVGGFW